MPTPYTAIIRDTSGALWAVMNNADTPQAWIGERVNRDFSLKDKSGRRCLVRRAGAVLIHVL